MSKKKKKQKVKYYDDNSTVVDMSALSKNGKKNQNQQYKQPSTFKDKWKTYWDAVGRMVVPMCIVLLIITVIFLFLSYLGQS